MRKPFYRKSHKCWYCKDASGKFIRLDPEESVAWEMWSRIQSATQLGWLGKCMDILTNTKSTS